MTDKHIIFLSIGAAISAQIAAGAMQEAQRPVEDAPYPQMSKRKPRRDWKQREYRKAKRK